MKIIIARRPAAAILYLARPLLVMTFLMGCANTASVPAGSLSSGQAVLSWNEVPGALAYNVYFSRSPGVTKLNGFKIRNATNPITIVDLEPGRAYYFVVTVMDKNGESVESREKTYIATDKIGQISFDDLFAEKPAPRIQTTNAAVAEGQVTLSWDDVPDAAAYNIYWRNAPGVTKQNGKKIPNAKNPYTVKGLERGKTYYFVVTAVKGSMESKESEEAALTVK
jgi:fibronectin type 3 domain-containing protein